MRRYAFALLPVLLLLSFLPERPASAGDWRHPPLKRLERCSETDDSGLAVDSALLPTLSVERPNPLTDLVFMRVNPAGARVYASPSLALAGGAWKRSLRPGFVYVSLESWAAAGGSPVVEVNPGEYMRAADLTPVQPSQFEGLAFSRTPSRAFGWVLQAVAPRCLPGGPANPSAPRLQRYEVVQVFDRRRVGRTEWYLVGPNQWLDQDSIGIVDPGRDLAPPAQGKWIFVNLDEQTLSAHEDGELVYATLVSTGTEAYATDRGRFRVYYKVPSNRIYGAYDRDRQDYYDLEDVPWMMHFIGGLALHGTYWHDDFGRRQSHGCVNLSLADSHWLYQWADEGTGVYID